MKKETHERDVLKAELILSDITMTTDYDEKKILINILDRYVMRLEDPAITEIFNKITVETNDERVDLYYEILADILEDRKTYMLGGVNNGK